MENLTVQNSSDACQIEKDLYDAAVQLIKSRYPAGWGGAAAVRTASGKILTSIAPDVNNDALSLCMEVGAYLEAHKLNEAVTHSLCLCREDEQSEFLILSPCGVCQERLVHWGGDVKAAISTDSNHLVFKTIRELMPHHWSLVNGDVL
ncbi:cytidine deaminase [Photobacterium sp. TY1-4]|uniref:cytidine deaminase n=1 Tax=Photobacterium sp. TY1-4 TaxID=2899122 RepID=UPI0021C22CAC|nr:cytidine deaminase [Photobacterium sp. TY1-4]UXI03899.1 cytidine deaminase [Photobacterium sp. TY1-4]